MVQAYQKHWLAYHQGVRYLDNLFSYFNRVVLAKHRPSSDPAIPSSQTPQRKLSEDSPIEISQVCSRGSGEEEEGRGREVTGQGSHDTPPLCLLPLLKDHMTCLSSPYLSSLHYRHGRSCCWISWSLLWCKHSWWK